MPALLSQASEMLAAESTPDGLQPASGLDPDLDAQDIDLHVPESELEIALPGRW